MKNHSVFAIVIFVLSLTLSLTIFTYLLQASMTTTIAPDDERLKLVADVGGSANFVTIKDNYAYVGQQHGIRILDITHITTPVSIGHTILEWAPVEEIVVSGDYAFVAAGYNGMHILSLANPESPDEIGAYDTPHPGYTKHLVANGNYLYMADSSRGAISVDISDPASPQEIGRYDPTYMIVDVAYANDLLYAANSMDGIHILDVSDPTAPDLVGLYQPAQNFGLYERVDVIGNYLYVLRVGEFLIADVTDPAQPTTVATYDIDLDTLTLSEEHAYLGWSSIITGSVLQVADISDPQNLNFGEAYLLPDSAKNIEVLGNNAFISNQASGVRIIDINDPDNPVEIGAYTPVISTSARVVGYANDHIYVHVMDDGPSPRIFDVSNPTAPVEVGTYDYLYDMVVNGDIAFTLIDSGVRVLDVSDAVNPNEIGFFPTPWLPQYLASDSDRVVIANRNEFLLVDVADPASPVLLGMYAPDPPVNEISSIDIADDYVYFKESFEPSFPLPPDDDILHIVSIADPANPTFTNKVTTEGIWGVISADGHYVYVCCRQVLSYGQIIDACCDQIFDVSDPFNVRQVAAVLPPQIPPHPYQDWWVMDEKNYVYFGGNSLTVWLYEPIWRSFLPLVGR